MEIRRTVLVPHSAERMFDLIEAAEHYPRFLPWCANATIVTRDPDVVVADITVNYHGVRFGFTTRNPKRRPEWMAITLERGPFRRFEGEWQLRALGEEGSHIVFTLRYDFESGVMRTLAGPVFERITNTLVDAFVARADVVYAGLPPAAPTAVEPTRVASAAAPASPGAPAPVAPPAGPLPPEPSLGAPLPGTPPASDAPLPSPPVPSKE